MRGFGDGSRGGVGPGEQGGEGVGENRNRYARCSHHSLMLYIVINWVLLRIDALC